MSRTASNDGSLDDALWTAPSAVIDPDIGLDIVMLGLVHEAGVDRGCARITYTLTTPGCPMERIISDGIQRAALVVGDVTHVEARLVWDPGWPVV